MKLIAFSLLTARNLFVAILRGLLLLVPMVPMIGWAAEETEWPQFRGPRGDGTSRASALPIRWGEEQDVKWKTAIHGRAWSSPVIWGDQVWLTTATEDGKQLSALCVDKQTGAIKRDLKLFEVEKPQAKIDFNTYASPTPIVESGRVYVTFGSPGTACLDSVTGEVLWERRDFICNHYRGAGSSLILFGDLLIVNYDGSDLQYVVAVDKKSGRTVWQKNRSVDYQDVGPDGKPELEGDMRKAFATCHAAKLDGQDVLLSPGSRALYAYEPLTGDEIWRVEERTSYSTSARPLVGNGLVFFQSGFSSGQILAIRPGRKGEILDARETPTAGTQLQVVWKVKKHVPKKPSLILLGESLFGVDDSGNANCWDAKTGNVVWNQRLEGDYSASPIAAADRIYFFSEKGKTTVVAAEREFKQLSENQLGDGFMASPAVSGKALFLRSRTHLYRIEE
jgi:outer membrane protein assembly factor BamB